ncbi:MAG: BlaI/MecI/CopY family transcriptional regulator [bacterium]
MVTGKTFDDLGPLQQAVMQTVWEMGEATVQQVLDRLTQEKPHRYTTILSIMQRLEKAGWLEHRTVDRTYIYRATSTHESEAARSLKNFVNRVFRGNSQLMLQYFIKEQELSDKDLKALSDMIKARRKEKSDDRRSS